MPLILKASDLKFRYPRDVPNREQPKFRGLPDPSPFNRDDLFDVLPMLTATMNALESRDGNILDMLEDILNQMPGFIFTREEVYDYLLGTARECLRP